MSTSSRHSSDQVEGRGALKELYTLCQEYLRSLAEERSRPFHEDTFEEFTKWWSRLDPKTRASFQYDIRRGHTNVVRDAVKRLLERHAHEKTLP